MTQDSREAKNITRASFPETLTGQGSRKENITSSIPPLPGGEERVRITPLTLQSDVIHRKYLSTDFWKCIKTPIFIDFFGVLSAFQRERYV